jgi:plastocyanin
MFVRGNGWRVRSVAMYVSISSILGFFVFALVARPDPAPVTMTVEVGHPTSGRKGNTSITAADASNIAVWLTPTGEIPAVSNASPASRPQPQIAQNHKSFEPHVLIVRVGTAVQFPNKDPFLHNVFSLFDGKRFDLGFYEAGSSKTVHFDKVGVSFLFCNIHPEMSGAVIAVDTPYFGLSDRSGHVSIPDIPDGRYQLAVWDERSLPEELKSLSHSVTINDTSRNLEPVRVVENPNFTLEHKNKYGQDYVPPASANPIYSAP